MSDLPPTEEVRRALLAAYAAIDAEGGEHQSENGDFNRGFRVGLELALVKLDQMLNAGTEPDPAWVAEGFARLQTRLSA